MLIVDRKLNSSLPLFSHDGYLSAQFYARKFTFCRLWSLSHKSNVSKHANWRFKILHYLFSLSTINEKHLLVLSVSIGTVTGASSGTTTSASIGAAIGATMGSMTSATISATISVSTGATISVPIGAMTNAPIGTTTSATTRAPPGSASADVYVRSSRRILVRPRILRHAMQPDLRLSYDTLNIRSVNNKIEDVRQLMIDRKLNILALTETWHEDSDCSTIKRLRSLGMNVIETARPIPADTDIDDVNFINHGGIAVISRPDICVSKMSMRLSLSTFEHMCCRVTSGGTSMILAVL